MTETTGGTDRTVAGTVEPGFEGVREAFARNFADHGEVGAAVAIYRGGRKVVDLWGGHADRHGTPYTDDTLQLVFSTTKGWTALCAHLLVQAGELDVDKPVAHYWPEFAAAGKGDIPVRWLLSHQAGLPYAAADLTLDDLLAWDPVVEVLAAMEPVWAPGTTHGYHAVTFGWLVGEVMRRITGVSLGRFVADQLAGPLGLELWVGLPDDQQHRVAPVSDRGLRGLPEPGPDGSGSGRGADGDRARTEPRLVDLLDQMLGPDALMTRALGATTNRVLLTVDGVWNRPYVRAAEMPSANGVTNARSLAKLYAATIGEVEGPDGRTVGPLLSPEQLAFATEPQSVGPDKVLMVETVFGLGYMLSSQYSPYGPAASFGHSGAGGSMGFADPVNGIAFGYVMNRMLQNLAGDPRTTNLVAALYEAIGVKPAFV